MNNFTLCSCSCASAEDLLFLFPSLCQVDHVMCGSSRGNCYRYKLEGFRREDPSPSPNCLRNEKALPIAMHGWLQLDCWFQHRRASPLYGCCQTSTTPCQAAKALPTNTYTLMSIEMNVDHNECQGSANSVLCRFLSKLTFPCKPCELQSGPSDQHPSGMGGLGNFTINCLPLD